MKKKILNPYSYSHNFCFLFDSENIHDESLDQEESLRFICCGRLGVPSKKKKNRCSRAMEREEQSETITLDDTGNE